MSHTITLEEPHQPTPCVDQLLEMAREGLIDPLDLLTTTLTWGGEAFARDLCEATGIEWEYVPLPEEDYDPSETRDWYDDPKFIEREEANWLARRTGGEA
jgi:hypothetical protein